MTTIWKRYKQPEKSTSRNLPFDHGRHVHLRLCTYLPLPAPGILEGFTVVGIFHPWPGTFFRARSVGKGKRWSSTDKLEREMISMLLDTEAIAVMLNFASLYIFVLSWLICATGSASPICRFRFRFLDLLLGIFSFAEHVVLVLLFDVVNSF